MRIHEVPVDWIDDPDRRVEIVKTAAQDVRGVARLLASAPVVNRFLSVGAVSTLAYVALFVAMRGDGFGAGSWPT